MIRQSQLVKRIRAVWSQDPALDTEHAGWAAAWKVYEETANPDGLPLKDGHKATVFDCEPMGRHEWRATSGLHGRELADVTVAVSLRAVENFEGRDGRLVSLGADDFERDGAVKRLRSDVLTRLYDPGYWDEVASTVVMHSHLNPRLGQG